MVIWLFFLFDKDFRVQFWYTHAVEPFEEIYGVVIVGLNQQTYRKYSEPLSLDSLLKLLYDSYT